MLVWALHTIDLFDHGSRRMKALNSAAIAAGCMALGIGIGFAAKSVEPGIQVIEGKPDREAGLAALAEAEHLAASGTWELIAVGRVYYLSGDKAKAQSLFDRATSGKQNGGDWQRVGEVYAEAGDNAKAEESFQKMLTLDPKDDSGQAEVGAWYIRIGQRAKGEELLTKALQKHPAEVWHYVRAAEGLLRVPPGR
jgi:tetratricopeptide (TPR) repeat protein